MSLSLAYTVKASSSHSCSDRILPSVLPSPSTCRVLIPQCGRVYEPEWDGDGGGLLMWRSAAAIATWGLLSFNQTKPDDECALLGEPGEGKEGHEGWGKEWEGRCTQILHLLLSPSLLQGKKGLPAAPVYHLSRGEWAGEKGARSNRWWVSSGTQKIKHLILN